MGGTSRRRRQSAQATKTRLERQSIISSLKSFLSQLLDNGTSEYMTPPSHMLFIPERSAGDAVADLKNKIRSPQESRVYYKDNLPF